MNNSILEKKIKELFKIVLALNAYGSLELEDLKIIQSYLEGSFKIDLGVSSLFPCIEEV